MPIVVIQGARQVGKSTLAQLVADGGRVLTMDDALSRQLAQDDPLTLLASQAGGLLIIDEAQRAPNLILPLKAEVDRDRRPGRFLLTGSADLLHVEGVGDSLAGRAETVELMPLSQGELARRTSPEDFVTWLLGGGGDRLAGLDGDTFSTLDPKAVIAGGFPDVHHRTDARARAWFTSYIARLADHDASQLQDGNYAAHLGDLLRYLGTLGMSELVKAHLATSLSVAESTAAGYVRLARTMRLMCEFPAWNRVPHRRVVKRPKVSLLDTGLSASLAGFTAEKALTPGGREFYGTLVEQFASLELLKQRTWTHTPFDIFHYRELDGLEVDLVLESWDGRLIAVEVKATRSPSAKDWSNLLAFRERFADREVSGVLLHGGDTAVLIHKWLHVLPITALWQHQHSA
jgi:predicted AAA+ superfamily ATPase